MSNPNDEMATNIANLNMTNVAKQVETGINNMSYLNSTSQLPQQQYNAPNQQYPQNLQHQQQPQLQMPQIQQPQLQMPQLNSYPESSGFPNHMNQLPNLTQPVNEKKTKNTIDLITNNLREPILIAVVYVVLNHPAFLKAVGKYIPYILPGEQPSMFNLVIRGLMLGSVVVLLNKTVLK